LDEVPNPPMIGGGAVAILGIVLANGIK